MAGKQGDRAMMRCYKSGAWLALVVLLSAGILAGPPKTRKKAKLPAAPVNSAPLDVQIGEILSAPAAKDAFWGIEIRDLKADKIIYSQNRSEEHTSELQSLR